MAFTQTASWCAQPWQRARYRGSLLCLLVLAVLITSCRSSTPASTSAGNSGHATITDEAELATTVPASNVAAAAEAADESLSLRSGVRTSVTSVDHSFIALLIALLSSFFNGTFPVCSR